MQTFGSRWCVTAVGLAALMTLSLARTTQAKDNDSPTPILNCGDPKNGICVECGVPPGELACCDPSCEIIHQPPTTGIALHLKYAFGGTLLDFSRTPIPKNDQPVVEIRLKEALVSSRIRKTFRFKVDLTGADAGLGGLLYPIAFLGGGTSAIDTLRAQGYDVSVAAGAAQPCQAVLPAQTCLDLANQLSKSIDASLSVGNRERDDFLRGVQAIGYAPCGDVIF